MRTVLLALLLLAACERSSDSGERLVLEVARDVVAMSRIARVQRTLSTPVALRQLQQAACACTVRSCGEAAERVLANLERHGEYDARGAAQVDWNAWAAAEIRECISKAIRGPAPRTPAEGGATTGIPACDELDVELARVAGCGLPDMGPHPREAARWAVDDQRRAYRRMSVDEREEQARFCLAEVAQLKDREVELGCDR